MPALLPAVPGIFPETPSQTAGPYVHIGLIPRQAGFAIFDRELGNELAGPDAKGERVRIEGRVLDGLGAPCRDVLVEIWQADSSGRYGSDDFQGFGRAGTDFETGLYWFETVKPGRVPGRAGQPAMAPHLTLWLTARGINIGLFTRMYFADEEQANIEDPVLALVELHRRPTLLAARETRDDHTLYRFDIRLQGEGETVFFDV